MNLSAVIVNWNSIDWLFRLLNSFEKLAGQLDEIIVVDNASPDFPERYQKPFDNLKIYRLESNRGFSGAANHGIEQAESPFILLLNPDIELSSEAVLRLYEEIRQDSRCAIVCGTLMNPEGTAQTEFQIRPFPSIRGVVSDALFLDEIKNLFHFLNRQKEDSACRSNLESVEIEQPAAACWVMRRQVWKQIEGFDERFYPAWWEDVDFCKRVKDRGWTIRWLPNIEITHQGGVSLNRLGYGNFIRVFYRNLLIYWKKHHPASYPIIWLPVKIGLGFRLLFRRKI